jgi:pimeloyl-ACP methyl ester carboxylesterase
VVPLLESAEHRVLAPSLTGYGDKAHLPGPEVGLDTHVCDVVRLIEDQDLADAVLVGHSYAGMVISSTANTLPDRVAQLVYLDAMVPEDGESALEVQPVTRQLMSSPSTRPAAGAYRRCPSSPRPSACSASPQLALDPLRKTVDPACRPARLRMRQASATKTTLRLQPGYAARWPAISGAAHVHTPPAHRPALGRIGDGRHPASCRVYRICGRSTRGSRCQQAEEQTKASSRPRRGTRRGGRVAASHPV